ncbi:MAG: hypothetical protein NTZ83_01305 [Candidatus Pacearchaeota archaeon]|nr:hypothetical protein [Candidatus Pacearchaeota archaeon]
MEKKPKLKELNGVINSLLELDYRISDMKSLLYHMLASAKTTDFKLNLLTGKMKPTKVDDLGKMYNRKYEWFISRIKELGFLEYISFAELTLKKGIESVKIKTTDGRIFEGKSKY